MSSYGSDNFKTPNIDKLAQGGIRFEHAKINPAGGILDPGDGSGKHADKNKDN